MTKREAEILEKIRQNPMISQKDLAEELGIVRSSVGVHLSNLTKKGYIKGKGYIINEAPYICVIGGANIDITGFSRHRIKLRDSNLGTMQMSMGGVGRDIAETLVRLGVTTKLICPIGDDMYGKQIQDSCAELSIDIRDSLFLKNQASSVYLTIMDEENDLALGLSAMDICDEMDSLFFRKKNDIIKNARFVVLETNISEDSLISIVQANPNQNFFLDTVSGPKSLRAKEILPNLTTLKSNKYEAELLSGIKITNENDLSKVGMAFLNRGIQNVFITLGKAGAYYCNKETAEIIRPPNVKVVNTNGAGDAFSSGVIYGQLNNYSIQECAKLGISSAAFSVGHQLSVNPEIDEQKLLKSLQNFNNSVLSTSISKEQFMDR